MSTVSNNRVMSLDSCLSTAIFALEASLFVDLLHDLRELPVASFGLVAEMVILGQKSNKKIK